MMAEIFFNNKLLTIVENARTASDISGVLKEQFDLSGGFYLTANGRRLCNEDAITFSPIHCHPKVLGGKGGFGSMLRAIGAQIEKTTNREACRDLSGRRLRDINEEKRLKKWIDAQADREKEAQDRKQRKLERLCQSVQHEFKDENYEKERSALPEKVVDALEHGLKAGQKRKEEPAKEVVKKKPKLWVDDLVEDELSSGDDDNSDNEASCSSDSKVSTSTEQQKIEKTVEDRINSEDGGDNEVSCSSDSKASTSVEPINTDEDKITSNYMENEKNRETSSC